MPWDISYDTPAGKNRRASRRVRLVRGLGWPTGRWLLHQSEETFFLRGRLDMFPVHRIVPTRMQPQSPSRAMKSLARASRFNSRGFTMLELLVVLGILALLATLAISNVTGIFGGAQKDTAKIFVSQTLKTSLVTYKIHMTDFPSTAEGLQMLITPPPNKADIWHGPYIEGSKVPLDPWGEPYQYRYPGVKNKVNGLYDLWSKGPDKVDGNEDDIGNWEKEAAPAAK